MRFRLFLGAAGVLLAHLAAAQQSALPTAPSVAVVPSGPVPPGGQVGQRYRVVQRTGPAFVGRLVGATAQTLTFEIKNQGAVTVARADLSELVENPSEEKPAKLPYDYVGNGTHLYLFPTARNLYRGEAEIQLTDFYLLSANYGVTNNLSVGLTVPLSIGNDYFLALTPKFSVPVADKLRVGAGALLGFGKLDENQLRGGGIGYGLATYGTANTSLTLGLGYAVLPKSLDNSPLLVVGGTIRVARRVFLTDETYVVRGYTTSILGVRLAGPQLSVGAGVLYGPLLYDIYFPLPHLDVTYRFGKAK
ncbi:hypothetical protein GCM10027422_44850 [Hymenobacter arcticus]